MSIEEQKKIIKYEFSLYCRKHIKGWGECDIKLSTWNNNCRKCKEGYLIDCLATEREKVKQLSNELKNLLSDQQKK